MDDNDAALPGWFADLPARIRARLLEVPSLVDDRLLPYVAGKTIRTDPAPGARQMLRRDVRDWLRRRRFDNVMQAWWAALTDEQRRSLCADPRQVVDASVVGAAPDPLLVPAAYWISPQTLPGAGQLSAAAVEWIEDLTG